MDTANSSTTTAAPAVEGAAAPNPKAAQADRRARMRETARTVLAGPPKAPASTPAATNAPAAAAVAAIESTGATAPTQRPGESAQSYEVRLSKALRQNTELQSENVTTKRRVQELETEYGPIKTLIAAVKADPTRVVDLLEMAGTSPDQVAQLMIDGKITKAVRATLPPEVQARMDALEKAAKRLEEREAADEAKRVEETQQAETAAQRTRDLSVVHESIEGLKSELPLTTLLPGIADRVLNQVYAQLKREPDKDVNVAEELRKVEQTLRIEARALLTTEAAVKAIVGDDPKIRDMFVRALGLPTAREQSPRPSPASNGRAANEDGPRSLSHAATSEVPSRIERAVTKQERRERMRNAAKAVLSGA